MMVFLQPSGHFSHIYSACVITVDPIFHSSTCIDDVTNATFIMQPNDKFHGNCPK